MNKRAETDLDPRIYDYLAGHFPVVGGGVMGALRGDKENPTKDVWKGALGSGVGAVAGGVPGWLIGRYLGAMIGSPTGPGAIATSALGGKLGGGIGSLIGAAEGGRLATRKKKKKEEPKQIEDRKEKPEKKDDEDEEKKSFALSALAEKLAAYKKPKEEGLGPQNTITGTPGLPATPVTTPQAQNVDGSQPSRKLQDINQEDPSEQKKVAEAFKKGFMDKLAEYGLDNPVRL